MSELNRIERFEAKYPKSKLMFERSLKVGRGMNHDSRYCDPFSIIASHANGSRKWDIDGNEHIDYSMGHAALLFGHCHPAIVSAASEQVAKGSLFAHEHEPSIELAERVHKLVPAAEWVEFTTTGNEANLLIAMIARAHTDRSKIVKFEADNCGWTDEMNAGSYEPLDKPLAGRIPPAFDGAMAAGVQVIPRNNIDALEQALSKKDVAALFMESAWAHATKDLVLPETVQAARALTKKFGTVLVFDEVITGFRWSPGGWQEVVGVTPDLCSLGKVLGGGFPIGAVAGRAEVMEVLQIKRNDPEWNRYRKINHAGTYNANAVSAAASNAVLEMVATGAPQKKAVEMASRLCKRLNHEASSRGVDVHASQMCSGFYLNTSKFSEAFNTHMLLNGVHIHRGEGGWLSDVHTEQDIDQTVEAFGLSLDSLMEEGVFSK